MTTKKGKQAVFRQHNRFDSNELPCLELTLTKGADSFITESVSLSAKGWSVEEAAQGISFLVMKLKKIKGKS